MTGADVFEREIGTDATALPIHGCRVMVVDDVEWNRMLIGGMLMAEGFHNLVYAADGFDALKQITEEQPDIVLLDVMMPGLSGFDVCRRVRSDPRIADTPILVQTALNGVDERNMAFEVGADDLICKPLDRAELIARTRIHLENRLLIRDLRHYRQRLEGELDVAREMFRQLQPGSGMLERIVADTGLEVRSQRIEAAELCGDLWGVVPLGPQAAAVYVIDMAGRGLSSVLNACRLHTVLQELIGSDLAPSEFLQAVNQQATEIFDDGAHASMLYGVVDMADRHFTYAGAAASGFLLVSTDGSVVPRASTGPPIGVSAQVRYDAVRMEVPAGTGILLFSNAVLDAVGWPSPDLGFADVVVRAVADVPAAGRFERIATACAALIGEDPADDHTLVWIAAP